MTFSTDPGSPPVLEARGVNKEFPGVKALDDVSLSLHKGEVHALVGENGAGKSTLIKVLTGVYPQDAGQLFHHQVPVTFRSPGAAQAAGISTIYQEVNLVPTQSAARNLYLGREPRTRLGLIDFTAMHRAARELLDEYSIRADVEAPLASLGLGTQQMIAVARAVAIDANVVIMDEPTSSLEAREVETLFGVIDRLRARGVAIIYVSHRLDELYRICDTVTVLRDGKLVHTGPLAGLPRLQLVATMLGRELLAQTKRHSESDEQSEGPYAEPVLEVRNITRRGVLDNISFAVRPGEIVGLGGLLGAGRTETGMAVLGAQDLDAGTVAVDGRVVRAGSPSASIAAGVALLPEDRKLEGILPSLSIRDNIVLAALPRLSRAGLVSDRKVDEVVATFMKQLHIRATGPDQKVGTLSGGNQQKVMLARLLCLNPKVLILDEPTRGIDVGAKTEVRVTIDELAAAGLAVLLISSETEELVDGSDRIIVLREGQVTDVLTGDRLSEDELVRAIASVEPDTSEEPTDD
ncbi:MAG: sugar ABC transporter ATP-binding protein [Cellulomonas sp.]|uniref:sugar ABC transporter ATP-binding protein n=1 Tax=Cellulomonas sp. TaxID=40001 RepID=UPI0017BBA824|nr:sugar ABC transporter ATP-binding protein [Cellulomonas sp.]NMM30077.1 sugar ABC transporter ATP-binding protein [Cellulomonas sp.]